MKHIWIWVLLPALAVADSPERIPVSFNYTWDVGFGRAVFVVGNHPDLGNWTATGGVKLTWSAGNNWTGTIGIQAGTTLEYKYIARTNSPINYCNMTNVEWMPGANLQTSTPAAAAAPYSGKMIYYHSSWTSAAVIYRSGANTNWYDAAMTRLGSGRTGGEYLYRVQGVGEEGEFLEFIPHGWSGGVEYYDHAPYGGYGISNYYTTLDVLFLQDGNVYDYWPPTNVSGSQIIKTNIVSSWAPTIPSRSVWTYLPRGYAQNTWKRYPVLYFHDGTNVFQPGGIYGCWNAEGIADREISQGRMREAILVAVDTSDQREWEYCPPGDNGYGGTGPGTGDLYANFLIHNVRPIIDAHYRTLTDRNNTLTAGSSMGGLISTYLGLETNVFGKIGAFSPAYIAASNFVGRMATNMTKGIRIYMDDGTEDLEAELWETIWGGYDLFLQDQYAVGDDLMMVIGCGQTHNEAAWAARLPAAYQYLLNLRDEVNHLARTNYPPSLNLVSGLVSTVSLPTLGQQAYTLETTTNLMPPAWVPVNSYTESLPWSVRTMTDTNPLAAASYYRVRVK